MGCLSLNTKENEGITVNMSNKKRNDLQIVEPGGENSQEQGQQGRVISASSLLVKIVLGVTGALCVAALGVLGFTAKQVYDLNRIVAANSTCIENMQKDTTLSKRIDNIETSLNGVNEFLYGSSSNKGLDTRLTLIEELLNMGVISASSDLTESIDEVSVEPNHTSISKASFTGETCIGTDADGNACIAEDFINETILLTYMQDDKEVYFLGQYNENYHWDGYCVINAYNSDGSLYGICESNYKDGRRLDYKSFCSSETADGEWIYSDKKCKDNSNSGINILYSLDYDEKKNFTSTNVRITDILYADRFVEKTEPKVLTYYSGNTSDDKYNDDTGKAYEIIYHKDGTVKTLYVGRFKDGTFYDTTGKAWDIAYSDKLGYYVHNTGNFRNGNAEKGSSEQITEDEIESIISGYDFKVELKWK
ncbi:MAG: hypothetical protein ACI39H_08980 [Lachnospiraceae bacterium]